MIVYVCGTTENMATPHTAAILIAPTNRANRGMIAAMADTLTMSQTLTAPPLGHREMRQAPGATRVDTDTSH